MASGSTEKYSFPYPISTDPVNVSGDIEQLAVKVDNDLQEIIEDTSAEMWTGGTFSNGINTPTYNDSTGKMTLSLSQDIQTSSSPTFSGVNLVGGNLYLGQSRTIIFEGSSDDSFKTTLTVANPTANRTVTFQNVTGTVALTSESTLASLLNIASSTGAITLQMGYGATTNGTTKTINIGPNGVAGSTTNINLGSAVSGALGTLTINSPTVSIPSTAISLGTITSGIWNGTEIAVNRGGTGLTSYVVGDIIYASASATLTRLAGVATGNALISGGVGAAPSWGKVGLTTHVSGTLPVANGGTGITSFGSGIAAWLGTPSSANLAAAITDETGSGALVFASGPALTGVPSAPTAAADTNTTQLATTAFVIGQAGSSNPLMDGTVSVGTSLRYSRQDHRHPIDTSRAPVASPTFTGTVSSTGTQIIMSSATSGSPTNNVLFTVERGTQPDVSLRWNEIGDTWQFTNDGVNYTDIGAGGGGSAAEEVIGITFFTMGA